MTRIGLLGNFARCYPGKNDAAQQEENTNIALIASPLKPCVFPDVRLAL
jgi:hypothetical protein